MTTWLPDLQIGDGPLYAKLARSIETGIETGELPAGSKLPPQRNLAFDLGVTVGTVSRAYSMMRERGLVSGEIGRGTYVLDRKSGENRLQASKHMPIIGATEKRVYGNRRISMTSTAAVDVGQREIIARTIQDVIADSGYSSIDYIRFIPEAWQEAGATWLSHNDWRPDTENVIPTIGVHSGIMAIIQAISATGDRIAFEELTYPATARAVSMVGRRIARIKSTDRGIDPEDFEHVCAQQHPKAVVLVATLNNPTLGTIPEANRRRIVEIARKYNVWIIEDNIYGGLKRDRPIQIAKLAPERTFLVDGMSKAVSAGLRTGWVSCPPGFTTRIANAHRLLTGGGPFILEETSARMVLSGAAAAVRSRVQAEMAERVALAVDILTGSHPEVAIRSDPECAYVWVTLPEPWLPGTFCKAAQEAGVVVEGADEYKVGSLDYRCPNIRLSLTGSLDRRELERGLSVVADLLSSPGLGFDSLE